MSASLHTEKTIFLEAAEIASPTERAAFLERSCGDDRQLRAAVEALLLSHQQSQGVLDATAAPLAERPGTIIGPYKLLQQIGEGGMGVVFMAEQTEPVQRTVALKIIKPGMDTRQVIARFEAERQALALMDHPNIAKVLDAGTTDSRPALLRDGAGQGRADHRVLRRAAPDAPRSGWSCSSPVCQAVQHAHQKGIIHRDLKPSNVLVADVRRPAGAQGDRLRRGQGDRPAAHRADAVHRVRPDRRHAGVHEPRAGRAQPARRRHPQRHLFAGRAALRAADRHHAVRRASGCKQAAFDEMLRIIREEEPPKPSTRLSIERRAALDRRQPQHRAGQARAKLVRGELDWIVMKCLEKDRNRRYETANGLAADIERYLARRAGAGLPAVGHCTACASSPAATKRHFLPEPQ